MSDDFMLDGDDLDFTILFSPPGILGLIILVTVIIIVFSNIDKCSQKHCNRGKPVLVENACRCLEDAE